VRIPPGMRSWWRERSARRGSLPGTDRAAFLRASYLEHLEEEGLSPEQRVAHHLYHLMLYWSRLIGFLDLAGDDEAAAGVLRSDCMLMVRTGTELADADVLAHGARPGAKELGAAWRAYRLAVERIPFAAPQPAHVRAVHTRFARVDDVRRALHLLSRWEAEAVRPPCDDRE
jgi:hypothetical protein